MIKRLCVFALLVLVTAACGGSPTSPGGKSNISGNWSGQTVSPQFGTFPINITVAQTGASLSGNWSSGGGDGGSMSGSINGASVTMDLQQSSARLCPYNATVTVNGSSQMSGTYAAYNCTGVISGTVTLNKK